MKITNVENPIIHTKPKKNKSYGSIIVWAYTEYEYKGCEGGWGNLFTVYPDGHSEIYRPTKSLQLKQVRYDTTPIEIDRIVMQSGREVVNDERVFIE